MMWILEKKKKKKYRVKRVKKKVRSSLILFQDVSLGHRGQQEQHNMNDL